MSTYKAPVFHRFLLTQSCTLYTDGQDVSKILYSRALVMG